MAELNHEKAENLASVSKNDEDWASIFIGLSPCAGLTLEDSSKAEDISSA